jgi:hypothetical protein
MRLVIVAAEIVKGCKKKSCALAIEYKSKEAVKRKFRSLSEEHFYNIHAHIDNSIRPFTFCGHIFDSHDYYYKFEHGTIRMTPVKIYTLDEWFEEYVGVKK